MNNNFKPQSISDYANSQESITLATTKIAEVQSMNQVNSILILALSATILSLVIVAAVVYFFKRRK